ncbi:flagella biosynthesis regulator [Sodalis-like endosymbiont of Proechinophthirus fluctus]|uniref:flagella biosynthesis regulator n=1 Tax=Sodalis-like endosymbiont of Proechinophthirus fluctus TaxID=1462730 RepID=UPI0007A80D76|nr:flagella biosynthesis regulator [Sodalis-like endosymbiont of Proechinophthirus fluctus]KYP96993.1 flagella biosynthesis regulator [Sodalis-like endosymbiont of Proechinophthirus fluctus]
MQPVTVPGTLPQGQTLPPTGQDRPLTTAQRTTLDRLITCILALSPNKPAEIWAALLHHLHIAGNGELRVRHFIAAEQMLQRRLLMAKATLAGRQLLRPLTDLLPQSNNRQAVSDYIRNQFGHTVLSQSDTDQLCQILQLLQSRQLDIPASQQHSAMTDRTLLPVENQAIGQLITKLAALTSETPTELWESLHCMMGLNPIFARYFPLLSQFLQSHFMLSQQRHPTLTPLSAVPKYLIHGEEQQAVEQYCRQHFAADRQTPLTTTQVNAVMQYMYIYRLSCTQSQHQTPYFRLLQTVTHPLIATEHAPRTVRESRSPLVIGVFFAIVLLVIWLLAR